MAHLTVITCVISKQTDDMPDSTHNCADSLPFCIHTSFDQSLGYLCVMNTSSSNQKQWNLHYSSCKYIISLNVIQAALTLCSSYFLKMFEINTRCIRNAYRSLVIKSEGKRSCGRLGTGGRIVLKCLNDIGCGLNVSGSRELWPMDWTALNSELVD